MAEPLYSGEGIKTLIPQREPIIMLDTFYDATADWGHTGLTVKDDNFFCEDGRFTEPGLIEHIAQSAAAFAGYNSIKAGKGITLGFIGEVKKFALGFLPNAGDRLDTEIKIKSEVLNITLLEAETKVDGRTVAKCMMKISMEE